MNVLFWWIAITVAAIGFIMLGLGVARSKQNQADATRDAADNDVCPQCGYLLRSTAEFCGHCGHHLSESDD